MTFLGTAVARSIYRLYRPERGRYIAPVYVRDQLEASVLNGRVSCTAMMKDPDERIRELEDQCKALHSALDQIEAVASEPNQTLPALKRHIADIVAAAKSGDNSREMDTLWNSTDEQPWQEALKHYWEMGKQKTGTLNSRFRRSI